MRTLIRKLREVLLGSSLNGSDLGEIQALLRESAPSDPAGVASRIPRWLASRAWLVRNGAIKLIGRLRLEPYYGELERVLTDRAEAGIVRRNAAQALAAIGEPRAGAIGALLAALEDPYWEVRAQAAMALATLAPGRPDELDGVEGALLRALGRGRRGERNFEVRAALARGLGSTGRGDRALDALEGLAADPSWIVRHQAAVALAELGARRPDRLDRIARVLDGLDLSSEGTLSYSLLGEEVARLQRAVAGGGATLGGLPFQALYLRIEIGWCAGGDRQNGRS